MLAARPTDKGVITIGTRASKLALAQTEIVRAALLHANPGLSIRVEHITTKGDTIQDRPLSEIGGNGLFVTQIEAALRSGQVDLAVHSAKDLSSTLSPGMALPAFLIRADARDALVSREGTRLMELPPGAKVGTSSPRRTCLIRSLRPDLVLLDIRGNVDTRLRKLYAGEYSAIVLAAAGLERLGMLGCVSEWLDPDVVVPAVAQGALAVQTRADDTAMLEMAAHLDHWPTSCAARAERAFLARIGGGCSLPIGAYATLHADTLRIRGMVGSIDGDVLRGEKVAPVAEPEAAGATLAEEMLAKGGQALIEVEEARHP